MSENNNQHFDDSSDLPGQHFFTKSMSTRDDCAMSEKAILYAAGDLGSGGYREFSVHLNHCRFCLNLILDLRLAEEEARESEGQPVQVLPALNDVLNKSTHSQPVPVLMEIVSSTIGKLRSLLSISKLLVPLATACLVFIIVQSGFKDTDPARLQTVVRHKVGLPKQKISEPVTPPPRTTYKAVTPREVTSEKQVASKPADTIYSVAPLKNARPKPRLNAKLKNRVPRTTLQKLDLIQLKLVGIVQSPDGNKAIFEDLSGNGHILTTGSYIGPNSGRVIRIEKDSVIIAEEFENESGVIEVKEVVLRLPI
jgi:Tfp pilus assembly protein PilP